ncbi:aldehyde dehydrogenase family protein [Rhizobium sp. 2YAF20]|uniref:aldehyde dehydrogenase family protein n=1 Tax=Rhizobium sp. 2YAF20 TaxID=3233027 RepID=UPI003F962C85
MWCAIADCLNNSEFGLAVGIWTKEFARAIRMAEGLQSGTVWVPEADKFTVPLFVIQQGDRKFSSASQNTKSQSALLKDWNQRPHDGLDNVLPWN